MGLPKNKGKRLYFLKYPIPKILEDSEKNSGIDWVLKKVRVWVGYRVPAGHWSSGLHHHCPLASCVGNVNTKLLLYPQSTWSMHTPPTKSSSSSSPPPNSPASYLSSYIFLVPLVDVLVICVGNTAWAPKGHGSFEDEINIATFCHSPALSYSVDPNNIHI